MTYPTEKLTECKVDYLVLVSSLVIGRNCKELLSGLFGGPAVSVLRLSLAPRQILTIETVMGAAFVSKGERRITGFTINIQGMYSTGRGLGSIQKQSCFERQHGRTEQFSKCLLRVSWETTKETRHSSRSQFGHRKSKAESNSP